MKNLKNNIISMICSIIIGFTAFSGHADTLYNYYTGEWELGSSNDSLKYNYYENEWSYESPSSSLEYNYYENEWEYTD